MTAESLRRVVVAAALAVSIASCQEKKTKEQVLDEREKQIIAKIEDLQDRQQQIVEKLEVLQSRLAVLRQRKDRLRDRWAEPTATATRTTVPSP